MRMKLYQAGCALAVMLAMSGAANAEGEFSGNVALTTDYVWRGISQSTGDLAISGGFDYSNGMFYAGTWASNVDFDDSSDTNVEIDFYGGLAGELANGISWDVGVIYYAYPNADESDLDFLEIKGALGYSFESGLSLGGEAYYDIDNKNLYLAASAGFSLTESLAVDAGVGNYQFDAGGDYTNWSLGGTYSAMGFDFDLRYWDTDVDASDLADERVVFTIARAL